MELRTTYDEGEAEGPLGSLAAGFSPALPSELAAYSSLHKVDVSHIAEVSTGSKDAQKSPEVDGEPDRDYLTEGMLLMSFMLLRSMVALRSLDYTSHELLWGGIAFAVLTRCISEGLVTRSCEIPGLGALIAIATREAFHVYGLRLVLDNFLVTEC